MRIHAFDDRLPPTLGDAVARFERGFQYPLGEQRSFRIEHSAGYLDFFAALGRATCWVAERQGEVLGILCQARRQVRAPDGHTFEAIYLGDLKAVPAARGRTVHRLLQAALAAAGDPRTPAFAVVMDGTRATPATYSGRLGLPRFRPLATLDVLRFELEDLPLPPAAPSHGEETRLALQRLEEWRGDAYRPLLGDSQPRARHPRQGFVRGQASALLEDTLAAKRLIDVDSGAEWRSGHLSGLVLGDFASTREVVLAAAAECRTRGLDHLFLAHPTAAEGLAEAFAGLKIVHAQATVYGTNLPAERPWWIDTAEI